MTLLFRFWRWLTSVLVRQDDPVVVRVASMNDVPEDPGVRIFIVGSKTHPKWVVLSCPCQNRERIEVNLMRSRSPFWLLRETGDSISLTPSLWMPKDKCGSHFWVTDNRIAWVVDGDLDSDSSYDQLGR